MHSLSLYAAMGAALKSQSPVKIASESLAEIGGALRDARISFKLEIEQVANDLMIAPTQIVALEKGDWSMLPAEVYARGYLRKYANYLGFDGVQMLEKLQPAKQVLELVQTPLISKPQVDGELKILFGLLAAVLFLLFVAIIYNSEDAPKPAIVRPVTSSLNLYMQGHSMSAKRLTPPCLQQRLHGSNLWECYLPLRLKEDDNTNNIAFNYF